MLMPKALPASILFLLVLTRAASADPITLISGTVDISGFRFADFESAFFSLSGERGFRFSGSAPEDTTTFGAVPCNDFVPCGPGGTTTAVGRLAFSGLGDATIDGTHHGPFISGGLAFHTSAVTIPDGPFGLSLRSPFTATGTFNIDELTSEGTRVPGTSVAVQGQGIVTTHFQARAGGFAVSGFTYEFAGANPTPEPGSLLLLASGSLLAFRSRRRTARMRG